MPLYEYQCESCEHRFERIQKFSDPPVDVCPLCGAAVKKLFSSPAIQFKGSGFYITDYPKPSAGQSKSESGSKSEGGGDTSSKGDSGSKGDGGSKGDSGSKKDSGSKGSSGSEGSGSSSASSSTPSKDSATSAKKD